MDKQHKIQKVTYKILRIEKRSWVRGLLEWRLLNYLFEPLKVVLVLYQEPNNPRYYWVNVWAGMNGRDPDAIKYEVERKIRMHLKSKRLVGKIFKLEVKE